MRSPAPIHHLNAFISRLLKASKVLEAMKKKNEKENKSIRNKNTTGM